MMPGDCIGIAYTGRTPGGPDLKILFNQRLALSWLVPASQWLANRRVGAKRRSSNMNLPKRYSSQ